MLGPLAGLTVAITADRRADEQVELLRRRGAQTLHAPVIRTLTLTDGPELEAATRALIDRPPDTLVALTAVGVRSWFDAADGSGHGDALRTVLEGSALVARGPKAAGALATVGLEARWRAPGESSREVLAHLGTDLAGRRIAVQRDGAARPHLARDLADRGADVVDVPVYRWDLPVDVGPVTSLVRTVIAGQVDAVTFTSAAAVSNLFTITAQQLDATKGDALAEALRGPVLPVCVGPVTAERLADVGVRDPLHPTRWRLGPMVRCLVDAMAGRRRRFTLGGSQAEVQGTAVVVGGAQLSLSRREARLLRALVDADGAVVAKERLAQEVWEPGTDLHLVEVTVGRLRRRLGPAGPALQTVPRRGYRIEA